MDRMGSICKNRKIPSGQSASVPNLKIITFSITSFQKIVINASGIKVLATAQIQKLNSATINAIIVKRQTYTV